MMKFAQALRRMREEEKGFTLIELMVVVVIIGILAAIAIPKITGIVYQSKVNADIATGKTVQDAVDRYMQNNTTTPTSLDVLIPDYINGVGGTLPKSQQDGKIIDDGQSGHDSKAITYRNGSVTVYNISSGTPTQVWP